MRVLASAGLVRPVRRRGFCPACRGFVQGTGATQSELAPPALLVVATLVVAAAAWVVLVGQSRSMGGMGLGPPPAFAAAWALMSVGMMLPSAAPLVFEFARDAEGRAGWRSATALLAATYLAVWLAFGMTCYLAYTALRMPWPDQRAIAAGALLAAGLYALSPLKQASEARCRELCAVHGPLPFDLRKSALVAGARYGVSCLGCSAGLMVALALTGMASAVWMAILTGVVLLYKLAPAPGTRGRVLGAAAVMALGLGYWLVA